MSPQADKGAPRLDVRLGRAGIGEMRQEDDSAAARRRGPRFSDQRVARNAAVKIAQPFDGAARTIDGAAEIEEIARRADRALNEALVVDAGVDQRPLRRAQDRFGRSHTVEQRARPRRAGGEQAAEMIMAADADDRRLGEAERRREIGSYRPERRAVRLYWREEPAVESQRVENLRRP